MAAPTIRVKGYDITLTNRSLSRPYLEFRKYGSLYYGELSRDKPSHPTLKVSKNGVNYYLIDGRANIMLANSNGSMYWRTDWRWGNDNAGEGSGYYDNHAALVADADVGKPLGVYKNTRLIMNTSMPMSQFLSRVTRIGVAFDNRLGLTSTHGGGNNPGLDSSYDWGRTCRGYGPQQGAAMIAAEISEPKRFADQFDTGGAERVVTFASSELNLNGAWKHIFTTPTVAEGAINNRRRKGRLSGCVTNDYYVRVRNENQIEILIRSRLSADADGGGPIANASGKISAVIWGER